MDGCMDCIHSNLKLISYEGTMCGLIVCGLEFRPMKHKNSGKLRPHFVLTINVFVKNIFVERWLYVS
ncbi:hypothetical protein Hanom_Chr16g01488701 [Helianthus anomalus]